MRNQFTVLGCVGTEPEFRELSSGMRMAKFRLAVRGKRKGQDHTSWFSVVLWDRAAEKVGHVKKGNLVVVSGSVLIEEYEHKGEARTSVEVNARDCYVVTMPRSEREGGGSASQGDNNEQW